MPIMKMKDWEQHEKINSNDEYGKCIIDVTREVMRRLDLEEYKDFDCHGIICDADKFIDAGGITGFMAGCVAKIVSHCHSRGEEFKKKWNEGYGVDEEKAKGGVVNPAIITVKQKQ